MTADNILERIFDGESDFEDLNESESDFEPDNNVSADVLANKPDKREQSIVDQNTPSDESEDEMDEQPLSSLNNEPIW